MPPLLQKSENDDPQDKEGQWKWGEVEKAPKYAVWEEAVVPAESHQLILQLLVFFQKSQLQERNRIITEL